MRVRRRIGFVGQLAVTSGTRPSPVRLPPPGGIPAFALVTESGALLVTETAQPLVYGSAP